MMQGLLQRKLRLLRAKRKLSLRQAAKITGLAKETLGDIERGKRHPNDVTLAKIAEGYGISLEELLDLEREPQEKPVLTGKAEAPETAQLTAQLREWIGTAEHVRQMIHKDIDELQRTGELPRGWERGVFGAHLVHDNVGRLSEGAGETEVSLAAKKTANVILAEVNKFLDEAEKVADRAEIRKRLSVLPGGKEAV